MSSVMVKRKKAVAPKPNLVPIMDAVFIFVFFLLMSVQFIDAHIIGSDLPVTASTDTIPPDKKPLALTLEIMKDKIIVKTGVEGKVHTEIKRLPSSGGEASEYDLEKLHQTLVALKKAYTHEETAIIKPYLGLKYFELVKIMDEVRDFKTQDEKIYKADKEGRKVQVKGLFGKMSFSNLAG